MSTQQQQQQQNAPPPATPALSRAMLDTLAQQLQQQRAQTAVSQHALKAIGRSLGLPLQHMPGAAMPTLAGPTLHPPPAPMLPNAMAILELVRRDPAAVAPALAALQAAGGTTAYAAAQLQALLRQGMPADLVGAAIPPPPQQQQQPLVYHQDAQPHMPVLPPAMLEKLQAIAMHAKVGGASWPAPVPASTPATLGPRTDSIVAYVMVG